MQNQYQIVYQEYCNRFVIYSKVNFSYQRLREVDSLKANKATTLLNPFGDLEVYCDSFTEIRNPQRRSAKDIILFDVEEPTDILLTVENKRARVCRF